MPKGHNFKEKQAALRARVGAKTLAESKQVVPFSIASNKAEVLFAQGMQAAYPPEHKKREIEKAKNLFKWAQTADPTHVRAAYSLAILHKEEEQNESNSSGIPSALARPWFERAKTLFESIKPIHDFTEIERHMYGEICFALDYYNANGIGGPQNLLLGFEHCKKALELGDNKIAHQAAERLAVYYYNGEGPAETIPLIERQQQALRYFEIAKSTHPYYQHKFGELLYYQKKYKEALQQWQQASEQGNRESMLKIALLFHFNLLSQGQILVDYDLAQYYYEQIIDTPDVDQETLSQAHYYLSCLYEEGHAENRAHHKAASLLKKAAYSERGMVEAQFKQGIVWIKEGKVEIGLAKIEAAAAQRYLPALIHLGDYYYGSHAKVKLEADPQKTYEIWKKAAEAESVDLKSLGLDYDCYIYTPAHAAYLLAILLAKGAANSEKSQLSPYKRESVFWLERAMA